MGLDIDLDKLDSIALDVSSFPHCTLELKNKGESFIKKVKLPTHRIGTATMSQINTEWVKVLERRYEQKQTQSKTLEA